MNQLKAGVKSNPALCSTVVCVTDQFACERLIKVGRKIADIFSTDLYVVNVVQSDIAQINNAAIEFLFKISMENNANMNILQSKKPLDTIIEFAKENHAQHIVTGMPENNSSIVNRLWDRLETVHFYTVSIDNVIHDVGSKQ